jgi:hypothetical protein
MKLRIVGVAVVVAITASCSGLFDDEDCPAACAVEVECGFRTEAACEETCTARGGFEHPSSADACIIAASDCAAVVECTCFPSCDQLAACGIESDDDDCTETCRGLVESVPILTYEENRCRIESTCETIVQCG